MALACPVSQDERPAKKERKKREPAAAKPGRKRKNKEEGEGGKKTKRKKKDPNAPKRGLSGFMYFSLSEREVCNAILVHLLIPFGGL